MKKVFIILSLIVLFSCTKNNEKYSDNKQRSVSITVTTSPVPGSGLTQEYWKIAVNFDKPVIGMATLTAKWYYGAVVGQGAVNYSHTFSVQVNGTSASVFTNYQAHSSYHASNIEMINFSFNPSGMYNFTY